MRGRRAHVGLGRGRMPGARALILFLASGACTQVLDLGSYSFPPGGVGGSAGSLGVLDSNLAGASGSDGTSGSNGTSGSDGMGNAGSGAGDTGVDNGTPDSGAPEPDASTGEGGTSSSGGASGAAGAAGFAGAGGVWGASGASGASGVSGATGVSGASGLAGASGTECGGGVCVPLVPSGWQGPVAVSLPGGSTECPSEYPSYLSVLNEGFQQGATNCNCGCVTTGASCRLVSEISGEFFDPSFQCESPPDANDCMDVVVDTTCSPQTFKDIQTNSWANNASECGGAAPSGLCSGGTCYPTPGTFGSLCISQAGDLACPAEFPNHTLYYTNFIDNRDCAACGCYGQGQHCSMDVEVCDLGFTEYNPLTDGQYFCLNTGDGDGVNIFSTSITSQGSCVTYGGAATGSAGPANPLTVCCL